MQKYREIQHHRDIFRSKFSGRILTLLIVFLFLINVSFGQDAPKSSAVEDKPKKNQTIPKTGTEKKTETPAENAEDEKEKAQKEAKLKELEELRKKINDAKDTSSRTVVLNTVLMKASLDKDYINLVTNDILVSKLEKSVLRDWLDAMAAIGSNMKELMLSEYVPNLLVLRINPDLIEKIDKIFTSYDSEKFFNGINSILIGLKEITYENQNVIRFAIDFAATEKYFTVKQHIRFIPTLIGILNVKLNSDAPKENGNHNGIGIIYEIVHKKCKSALNLITNFAPEQNDFNGWTAWWTEFQKKTEVEQYTILLENAHQRISEMDEELAALREGNQIQKLRQNAKSYEINAKSLTDSSNNVVIVALDNIVTIISEGAFDEKERENLVKTLYNVWYSDITIDVKKKITDLYLKLGGCEANLRIMFSFEQGAEIRQYIVERLSSEGKDGASLDKLIQIINEKDKYPSDIVKAAIKGLGKWNSYTDERNIKIVIKTLKEIITIHDEKILEPITLANTINELARKFNISELITHLFEVKPFKPQQLVVLLLSALRSGNSPELVAWLIEYERKNEYLTMILKDPESFIDLITTVFEIFEIIKEPFIESEIYTGLYDSLSNLYRNKPEGANGLFEQKLESTLTRLALPYAADKKFADLTPDKKKLVEKSALIVPELLMKRNMADFVLNNLLPAYPAELVQLKQAELEKLRVRLGLRSKKWDQLDIFTKYKDLVVKESLSEEKISEDITWSISMSNYADERVASRLIFAIQSVNPKMSELTWKTVYEFVDKQFKELKAPKGEIYVFKVKKMIFNLDSMKPFTENPTDKNLQAFLKLHANAKISYDKWFAETEAAWAKFAGLNEEALKFALIGDNYRVVLKNLIDKLIKLPETDPEYARTWKFIDEISTEKNLPLSRYKEGLQKNEIVKILKEMEAAIIALTLR